MNIPPMQNPRRPPKLDLRGFQAPPSAPTRRTHPSTVIDSHIHLWTQHQLEQRNITWPKQGAHQQLSGPHEMEGFATVVAEGMRGLGGGKSKWEGVVYVQAEAVHDDADEDGSKGGWDAALDEVECVCAAALRNPNVKLLALVPWAPVHHGSSALSAYFTRLFALPSLIQLTSTLGYPPVTSVRYLLQSSPRGFFLQPPFIDGLKHLGERGIAFDLTLDVRSENTGGVGVLEDAQEMITRVREGQGPGKETVFIFDHFAKPSLADDAFSTSSTRPSPPFRTSYISSLQPLSLLPKTYLKLSAFLDFAPPQLVADAFDDYKKTDKGRESRYGQLRERILGYLEPALEAWGWERILVGSDWPMFRPLLLPSSQTSPSLSSHSDTVEEGLAWAFGLELYLDCFRQLGLEGEELDGVFARNSRGLYGIGTGTGEV
ncbi:hypothetical protein JCM11641_006199 [Rhodosporidiobolus odoratus]